MPISVSIQPFAQCIDMYDSPNASSAYSLSGNVSITVTPSNSLFGFSTSFSNLKLVSLELSFEGQSELLLDDVGYSPLRLITVKKELLSAPEPIVAKGDDCAEWHVVFDMAVPGWIPATARFGDDSQRVAGVSYHLFARARFEVADGLDDDENLVGPAGMGNGFFANCRPAPVTGVARRKTVEAQPIAIVVNRYVSPPAENFDAPEQETTFSSSSFAIQPFPDDSGPDEVQSTNMPLDVLRTVRVMAHLPSRTSVDDDNVPLTLRVKCTSDEASIRNALRVIEFEADIVEVAKYHTSPSERYTTRFPLPAESCQPPSQPLRIPHPIEPLYSLGLVQEAPRGQSVLREQSLVPIDASKVFRVRSEHADDEASGGAPLGENWVRMEASVPISPGRQVEAEAYTGGHCGKRTTAQGPHLSVSHEMRVQVTMGYDVPNQPVMLTDELAFVLPLDFVRLPPAPPLRQTFAGSSTLSLASSTGAGVTPRPASASPYGRTDPPSSMHSLASSPGKSFSPLRFLASAFGRSRSTVDLPSTNNRDTSSAAVAHSPPPPLPPLPPYNQLFHADGNLKEDWQSKGALPLYKEKEEDPALVLCSSSSSASASSSSSSSPSPRSSPEPDHEHETGISRQRRRSMWHGGKVSIDAPSGESFLAAPAIGQLDDAGADEEEEARVEWGVAY